MTTLTLESIKAEQTKLAEMITRFEDEAKKPTFFEYQGERIPLNHGETYVGTIITPGEYGRYHLVQLPGEAESINWKEALAWAKDAGGELPNRAESALLFATLKADFKEAAYWTREQHASASDCAWSQDFDDGSQDFSYTYDKLRARAFRRLFIL